jgi:GNAT superfamily N-acetyltransferase
MQQNYKVIVESEIKPAEMNQVINALAAYNASKADGDMPVYLFITVRDDDEAIAGGLVAASYLGWLQVLAVWIADELRGQGYGTKLMQAAEDEAVSRGCPRIFLETLSFQALPFYEKRGYVIHSTLKDFPPGGARYALTKSLQK